MKRIHAFVVAAALAVALIAGTFAALRTTHLGATASAPRVSAAQIRKQNRALDRVEIALRKELRRKPPALPTVPSVASPPAAAVATRPQTVVYVRPKPIVHIVHRHGGEHGNEHEGHDGGGGGDD